MFAKLKREIKEKGGSLPASLLDGDRSPAVHHGPGLASPVDTKSFGT